MKTEEDEAFDELAKKQGSWGNGFQAKRAMAADKQEPWNEDEWRRNNWRCGHGWLRGEQCEICNAAQEPVAWTLLLTDEHHGIIGKAGEKFIGAPECYQRVDVYTTPSKREWVGLTDEEMRNCLNGLPTQTIDVYARRIEAKLKQKNNGT